MKLIIVIAIAVAAVTLAVLFAATRRESLTHAVLPGPLTQAHKELESRCSECHSAFKKEGQNGLCLRCHEAVKRDLESGTGFHGRAQDMKQKQCSLCHGEHKGRGYAIVPLDPETFDHHLTDFPLVGKHASAVVACAACHEAGKKFGQAPQDCFSCHAKEDKHEGKLGQDCGKCHNSTAWHDTFFDHGKTQFPLVGKHMTVACGSCHISQTFAGTATRCVSCHLVDDVHNAPQAECSRCHTAAGWKTVSFDHNKETKFVLQGKHAAVDCESCHMGNRFGQKVGSECMQCHGDHDVHKGRYGTRCNDCHDPSSWKKVTFDHDRDTKFKLTGKHREAGCVSCHKEGSGGKKMATACAACHQADDVHQGKLSGACDTCHNTSGWTEKIRFEHDMTDFPLIGMHAVASCGDCHKTSVFGDTHSDCLSCHAKDDGHHGSLGKDCAQCHNPNGWSHWEFDHNVRTKFKLEGAHEGLKCAACHAGAATAPAAIPATCIDCHDKDDAHDGRFGQRCDQCHTVDSFKKIKVIR